MGGENVGIYNANAAVEAMIAPGSAHLENGQGIVSDRYYLGAGTFSEKLKGIPDVGVALIEI